MKIGDPVFTKDNRARPSPPLNVETCPLKRQSMHVRWSKPLFDGNVPITAYVIEKKELNGQMWMSALQCPIQDCAVDGQEGLYQLELGNLITGKTYEFRISAINDAGISDPSASSNPQVCEAPYRKNISNTFRLTS